MAVFVVVKTPEAEDVGAVADDVMAIVECTPGDPSCFKSACLLVDHNLCFMVPPVEC